MESKLCIDTMMEVLSRTSLKSLDAFRCTSNEIDKLTCNSYFLDRYKQRNKIISGFLLQHDFNHKFAPSPHSNTLDLSFLPPKTRILASSEQGIIVFESHPNPRYHKKVLYNVCKPSTKQVLALPNPKTKYFTEKVAIIVLGSTPLHYKILRLSKTKEDILLRWGKKFWIFHCEIFDSLKGEWRLTDPLLFEFYVSITTQQPITTSGSIYMLSLNNIILQFDANLEKWSTFSLPVATTDYPSYTSKQLVKYEGKLAFACRPMNGCWEIWVRTNNDSWEKIRVFNKEKKTKSLEALYDSDTSVMIDDRDIVFYDSKRDVDIHNIKFGYKPDEMHVFRSDFETIDLTGERKLKSNI